LTEVNLNWDYPRWRLLASNLKFQTLLINLVDQQYYYDAKNCPLLQLLSTKYTGTFPRTISNLENLKALEINLHGEYPEQVFSVFQLFRKVDLSRFCVEDFKLKVVSCDGGRRDQTPYEIHPGMKKLLRFLTELTLQDCRWFTSIFDGSVLENLSALEIKISPQNNPYFSKKLMTFKRLEKLKKLDFSFRAYSLEAEREFLESFTLPKNLETVRLSLMNCKWDDTQLTKKNRSNLLAEFDNEQRFVLFFNQWKGLKSLKALELTINEESADTKRCPGLAGNFVSKIISQLNSLENLSFTHYVSKINPPKAKPLDLGEFWKALEFSKKSLQSLAINVPEVAFPPIIRSLNTQFPCLKTISLGKSVLWAKDLTSFWSGFRRLEDIEMKGIRFDDEERLEIFMDSLREHPKVLNSTFNINVEGIKYDFLMGCLSKLRKKKEILGNFELSLKGVQIKDQAEFGEDLMRLYCEANLNKLKFNKLRDNTLVLKAQ